MGARLGHGPGTQSSPCRGRRFSDRIDVRTGGTDGREEDDRLAKDSAGPPLTFLAFPLRSIGRLRCIEASRSQTRDRPCRLRSECAGIDGTFRVLSLRGCQIACFQTGSPN
jgi:hypothetical protein